MVPHTFGNSQKGLSWHLIAAPKYVLQKYFIGTVEVVFEETIMACFWIMLDIVPAWPIRATELWHLSLVVPVDSLVSTPTSL
jgi:hypothetical protein